MLPMKKPAAKNKRRMITFRSRGIPKALDGAKIAASNPKAPNVERKSICLGEYRLPPRGIDLLSHQLSSLQ